MDLTVIPRFPGTALVFGLLSVLTGAILLAIAMGIVVHQFILVLLGIFWTITGLLALWFGYSYWQRNRK